MDWQQNFIARFLEPLRRLPFADHLVDQLEAALFGHNDGEILSEDIPPGDASGVIKFGRVIEPYRDESGQKD